MQDLTPPDVMTGGGNGGESTMDSEFMPQYLRSTDPGVLAIIRANDEGVIDFSRRARAFAEKLGAEGLFASGFAGSYGVSGLSFAGGPPKGHGRWKKVPRSNSGFEPVVGNPLSKEMRSITFREQEVPGLPGVSMVSEGANLVFRKPRPFVWDDAAWVDLRSSHIPTPQGGWSHLWAEVRGWEYARAREEYEEHERTAREALDK